jgi:hypothetical protein
MAGDFQDKTFIQPPGVTEKGCYVALSEDDGETWVIKKLPGAQLYEGKGREIYTLGYTVTKQAPNGVIHLITTTNKPCLHFELNEAWILDESEWPVEGEVLMRPTVSSISQVSLYREKYDNGSLKAEWSAGIGDDGRVLLHGTETWYYDNGQKQQEASYHLGRKVGVESYWSRDGKLEWTWSVREDSSSVWMQWRPNGQKKSESFWRNMKCEGTAVLWDRHGNEVCRRLFSDGLPVK